MITAQQNPQCYKSQINNHCVYIIHTLEVWIFALCNVKKVSLKVSFTTVPLVLFYVDITLKISAIYVETTITTSKNQP